MRTFRISLCNEVLGKLPFVRQCALAAALGYDGLELAPFTLDPEPASLGLAKRRALLRTAEREGIAITGLHWLLTVPKGLSITTDDASLRARTVAHIEAMIELCADLGGEVLVHGSPDQRRLADAGGPQAARDNATVVLARAAEAAQRAGVVYCLEPLSPALTDFVTNIEEAAGIVRAVGSPHLATMIDTSAAWAGETEHPGALIRRHLPTGLLRHVHVNDTNRRAPGQGEHGFLPVMRALVDGGYKGVVGVEPFDYHPDGATAAAMALGYLNGLLEQTERMP
ncbi:sugar phosphate isomerase/epimerase family protein [Neoaquamicrobium sediminum]|uniref:sugar phosphate isomerase/epimerase family protein n=1 Tax=Neoaquamicrobium sediminum TaxID=1849104 RepID=UPI003BAB7816